jgi:hypothetical protein
VRRGSHPQSPGRLRRALLAHHSGFNRRPDMKARKTDENDMPCRAAGISLY